MTADVANGVHCRGRGEGLKPVRLSRLAPEFTSGQKRIILARSCLDGRMSLTGLNGGRILCCTSGAPMGRSTWTAGIPVVYAWALACTNRLPAAGPLTTVMRGDLGIKLNSAQLQSTSFGDVPPSIPCFDSMKALRGNGDLVCPEPKFPSLCLSSREPRPDILSVVNT